MLTIGLMLAASIALNRLLERDIDWMFVGMVTVVLYGIFN
jgi:hypothetical protein